MKIDSSQKTQNTLPLKETRGSATRRTGTSTSDEVQLSELSSQLRTPDDEYAFDAARVAEIKQAISEGRFAINADAIADRLIASAKELLDSRRHA